MAGAAASSAPDRSTARRCKAKPDSVFQPSLRLDSEQETRGSEMAVQDRGSLATALVTAGAIGALAVAFIAQYGFRLEPCTVCYWQRAPYAMTGLLGLL